MKEHSDFIKNLENNFGSSKYEDWEQIAKQFLKGKPFEKIAAINYEGIKVEPLFPKNELVGSQGRINEFPGIPNYIRGIDFKGYKSKPWYISQHIAANNATEFNAKAKINIERGQTAITVNARQILSFEATGNIISGNFVPADLESFVISFEGIDLKEIPINIFAGKDSLKYLDILEHYLSQKQLKWSDVEGGIDCDPIAELAEKGELPTTVEHFFDEFKQYFENTNGSDFRLISVCGMPYREGGGNVIHELAFTLSTAVSYIKILLEMNFSIDDIAKKIRFVLTTGNDFFIEISKIRAMRMLWALVIKEFGGNEISQKLNLYIKSIEMNKSGLDIWVNLLRNTTETLSSIIGGCNTIELFSFDAFLRRADDEINSFQDSAEKYKLPSEFSERISRNTQVVLSEECNLKEVIDPSGGSYFIEYLTNEIASKSWDLFREVEKLGGMLEALKSGFPQDEVRKTRDDRIKNLSTRKDILLGVNKYPNINEEITMSGLPLPVSNSQSREDSVLSVTPILKFRASEIFENLRLKSIEFKNKAGSLPKVFIVAYGPLNKYKARVDFTTDFMHVGGIKAEFKENYQTFEEAAKAFLYSSLNVVVLCSSDDLYPEFVSQFSRLIKRAKPLAKILLAGNPTNYLEEFSNAGVDEFIHVKADIIKILSELYDSIYI
ncbi:MAG: methylmalonyl-CoA mutase family protein [bacterium]